jgi:signal transduction histidine kinase
MMVAHLMQSVVRLVFLHPLREALVLACVLLGLRLRRQTARWRKERACTRRLQEELIAYSRIETSFDTPGMVASGPDAQDRALCDLWGELPLAASNERELARRICRIVASSSHFSHVAFMLRDPESRLYVAASAGMDQDAVQSLEHWGADAVRKERKKSPESVNRRWMRLPLQVMAASAPVERANGQHEVPLEPAMMLPSSRTAHLLPLRTLRTGRLVGSLVVETTPSLLAQHPCMSHSTEELLYPIETLGLRLARSIENGWLNERLVRAEKMAGLGQLAGGVAHELNNPLTAVLGFAELIAEESTDASIRADAATIATQARRMRRIVQSLLEFWRPVTHADALIPLHELVADFAAGHAELLKQDEIELVIDCDASAPPIRGHATRLRQLLDHLIENAAASIRAARLQATRKPAWGIADEEYVNHAIRITLTHDPRLLHLIISDSGTGFESPGRIFDPFYTTREPGEGAGLGLSLCYGITREHGGEISAFNLQPRGAAVVIELPVTYALSLAPTAAVVPEAESVPRKESELAEHGHGKLLRTGS